MRMRRAAGPLANDDTVRMRIVDATLTMITTDGLDAVRHRRIADLAGVSLGSTTYHFAHRDDLVEAAFLRYLELATEFLERLDPPEFRTGSPIAAVVAFIDRLIDALKQGLAKMNAGSKGSSMRVRRVLLMTEPPQVDGNEITDKGYLNQRATLQRRAALVERLYAGGPGVIEIE